MLAVALALGSSVLWGVADFLGGLKSRTYPVAVVLACMYLSSLGVHARRRRRDRRGAAFA